LGAGIERPGRSNTIGVTATETRELLGSSFQQWSEPWSRLGLWVSLWDERAECVDQSRPVPLLWQTLVQHSKRCWHRLRQIARSGLGGEAIATELEPQCGAVVIAAAITYRQRIAGTVLACGLTHEFFDGETLARFCDLHRVDRRVLEGMAKEVPSHRLEHLHAYADILHHHIQSFSLGALAHRDIRDLSAHLAQAYEELNLIYRVSADMTVSERPRACFEKVCTGVLEATVVESLATILVPLAEATGEPTVVTAGPLPASRDDVFRLYRQVCDRRPNAGGALVVNDAPDHPEFAWAGDWLRQFVFFELSKKGQRFGGVLAVNRRDGQDFGSEETQLVNSVAERSSAFLENVRLYDDLEQLFMGMLHALVNSIDAKDPYTCGHSQRVAWLSRHIAGLTGVSEAQRQRVYLGGLLHDIGKIGVSEAVLGKTGRLTPEEYEEMKRHPEIGGRILEGVRQVQDLIPGVLHHHERMDGKGYPHGLRGDQVPFLGRVVGLADSFDAITTSRTYRRAQPIQVAEAELRRCAGTQFDPDLTDLFLQDDIEALSRKMARSGRTAPNQDLSP
jgi:HD-GYP domain-containing protein (c-di-GMP phosphodiesterase class II)